MACIISVLENELKNAKHRLVVHDKTRPTVNYRDKIHVLKHLEPVVYWETCNSLRDDYYSGAFISVREFAISMEEWLFNDSQTPLNISKKELRRLYQKQRDSRRNVARDAILTDIKRIEDCIATVYDDENY